MKIKTAVIGMVCLSCLTAIAWAVQPLPTPVHHDPEPPYTTEELSGMLTLAKPAQGAIIQDVTQQWASVASALGNDGGVNMHTGFSIYIAEPKAFVGVQSAKALKEYREFSVSDLDETSRERVFRVFVHPDLPQSAAATYWGANSAEHVVLRSIDRKFVAQPVWIKTTNEAVQNIFGAQWAYGGLQAAFSMSDLSEIRSMSNTSEFFVTIIGEKRATNRDFRVKPKFFEKMGD